MFLLLFQLNFAFCSGVQTVALYKVFETSVTNSKPYSNKLADVTLNIQYQAPSGKLYNFYGFYDGDGKGGNQGSVWKMRFMPNELGEWKYVYTWSDGSKGGKGAFKCISEGAGKGVLQAYDSNPHWLAYNGTEPIWVKSYYETGHGSLGQDFDWVVNNVYQRLYEAGYNHLQVNWLLSLCCFEQYYKDGPEPETLDLSLYKEGDIYGSMNMDVWRRMEQHLGWLNDRSMGVHMFLGVDGSRNDGPDWSKLSLEEKDWFARYMVARLTPFANLAGWNFVWEVPGDREDRELGFARLISKYDIFNHLRTYEDEFPRENEYQRPVYNFAMVENHKIASSDREEERHLWKEPWTHHMACLVGYEGKPVFMCEGNALWRRFWQERTGATQDDLRRSAWACATAGASFTWNGHASEYDLYAYGSEGLPFGEDNEYTTSTKYIDILTTVMQENVDFFKMSPHDELLADHAALDTYLLAEPGEQYLVFDARGFSFSIKMEAGNYENVMWVDAKTGKEFIEDAFELKADEKVAFSAPDQITDWILIIRK